MNRRTLLLSPLALSLAPDVWAQTHKSAKLALVIGCKNYLFGKPLGNTLNDARDMKAALTTLGYDVLYLEDPSLKKLTEQLAEFAKKAKTASERVVYYSGHGVQVNGVNYLLPVTFQAKEMADLPDQALGLSQLMGALPEEGVNIVILDACRDNPFSKSFRSTGGSNVVAGLGNQERPTGTLIAYATKLGDVASDASPNGRNGLYTGELLKHLKTPGLTVEQVFKRTRAGVMLASNKRQQPWDESSLLSEFFFAVANTPKPAPVVGGKGRFKSAASKARIANCPQLAAYLEQMQAILGGSFNMGSNDGASDEKPVHRVTLTDYWLGRTLVAQELWAEYASKGNGKMPSAPPWGWLANHPIVNVSWNDIQGFCAWASRMSGFELVLPSEAQFEYAACGGGKDLKWPWGDTFDGSKCVHSIDSGNSQSRTAPIDRSDRVFAVKFSNGSELLDMSGNVWQWCLDWKGDYSSGASTNPMGASSGQYKVLRGGSWGSYGAGRFRCVDRGHDVKPINAFSSGGFRLSSPRFSAPGGKYL